MVQWPSAVRYYWRGYRTWNHFDDLRMRHQQATTGVTRNLPRMVQFPSYFPISPSYIYKDDGVACLVNQE